MLRDVSIVNTAREVLGSSVALPFAIAPTGFTRMMHTESERAGARAAGAAGIPFSLSTLGTATIEDIKQANPSGRNWFQLFIWKDHSRAVELIDRAAAAGFDTLLVTVDTAAAGARIRDRRNGLTVPPSLTLRTGANAALRPAWWFDLLTTEPLSFASFAQWPGTVADLMDSMFDPTVGSDDLDWVKQHWPGQLAVKGVRSATDAKRLVELGVDGIVLSNHGGRQLDHAPIPFHLLPEVAAEFAGEIEIPLDTGIINGADIVAAIALGARCTLIGRAYLYGLMAGGREGVDRAIEILAEQLTRTMRLLGIASLDELTPSHVTQLVRMTPRTSMSPRGDRRLG